MGKEIKAYNNILELVGNTPLIKLNKTVENLKLRQLPNYVIAVKWCINLSVNRPTIFLNYSYSIMKRKGR